MAEHPAAPHSATTPPPSPAADLSTGELVGKLSEQSARLVRGELELALAEMQRKAKRAGLGAGLFGTAGVIALFGLGVLITTSILALALVLAAWLSALIVGVVLLAVAGIAALLGKRKIAEATPLVPGQAIDGVKQDVATVKEARR